jgi:hypothetical protein
LTLHRTVVFVLAFLVVWGLTLFWPVEAGAQAVCSHWASSQGSGSTCSASQPCKIASWWEKAGPGKTLCLKSGEYRGSDSMLTPPPGLKGTQAAPITVRAEHDGEVTLDAQHTGFAVFLGKHDGRGNDWFVIEGINGTNGLESIMRVASSDSVLRRVVAWNGTSGAPTDGISIVGLRSRVEDCAVWGMNLRKPLQGSQVGNLQGATYRRCWAEWNDHPETDQRPNNTLQIGYNSTNQLFENLVLTWDTRGQIGDTEGVIGAMTTNTAGKANEVEGTRLLGSLLYLRPGATYSASKLFQAQNTTGLRVTETAMVVPAGYESVRPMYLYHCGTPPCAENVCTTCLAVHAGQPLVNETGSGWTLPGLRQGRSLAEATGGASAFTLLPGLCRAYDNGTLTDRPLWPWPMNERIKAARAQSGFPVVDVTAAVESALGPIPAACRTGAPSTDTTPPTVRITAPVHGALVSGSAVAVVAEGQDNVGVVSISFLLDELPVGEVYEGGEVHALADSTRVANGVHKFRAVARDAAGNVSTGNTIDVTVSNHEPPEPEAGGTPLSCVGVLGEAKNVAIACVPQTGTRQGR